ncbi:ribosomal protein S18-alanine N-acetyltransferase [Solicola gregarius]|uniref:[Ribosomal protein bS18]-alanine N-acetyltransferase n=1 Tax=Solicola gregarius TaxID=2908642 RepID=A0AA46TEE9_9ACTN|nr:ribosomal protein S18-alanine N-acetyltransferase [Solicola gregarius]UYM03832.1 ribosomal protein S18-alanine N-acetyltransferase [Solicola gregarius]
MIARATGTDLAALVEIERLCFGADAWSETLVRAELDALSRSVLVAREESVVVGYASVMATGDLADLQRVAVRPDRRGRGYGRRLLDEAMRVATLGGADRILLEVAADNGPAIALYRAAGFEELDRRVGYYGAGRDALVLRVDLDAR